MSVHGYFDTPLDNRRGLGRQKGRNPQKLKPLPGVSGVAAISYAIDRIRAEGWDPHARHIGFYIRSARADASPEQAMERLRAALGELPVMIWEMQPGRTQGDVVALLERAVQR